MRVYYLYMCMDVYIHIYIYTYTWVLSEHLFVYLSSCLTVHAGNMAVFSGAQAGTEALTLNRTPVACIG